MVHCHYHQHNIITLQMCLFVCFVFYDAKPKKNLKAHLHVQLCVLCSERISSQFN